MNYLETIAREVDKTHPRLGNLVAMIILATKARKCLLVISPSGCGKSRAAQFVANSMENVLYLDRVSIAGLDTLARDLTGFSGLVVIDDIAHGQTTYMRIATVETFAMLTYTHMISSHSKVSIFSIRNFYGASVINIQPVLLEHIITSDEWEASIADKSLRYYHLYRPLVPNKGFPKVDIDWGIDTGKVDIRTIDKLNLTELEEIGLTQWSLTRIQEHIHDLLIALAALNKRVKVNTDDVKFLANLLKPMLIESLIFRKEELEGKRRMEKNLLPLLVEFATYGTFSLKQLALDYKISPSTAYRIMERHQDLWKPISRNPTYFSPTEKMIERLKEVKLWNG